MTVPVEPFASVYDDGSRIDVILARGRRGFEAYVADDHSLELFPSPRKAAVAITTTRPWVAQTTAQDKTAQPEASRHRSSLDSAWKLILQRDQKLPCNRGKASEIWV